MDIHVHNPYVYVPENSTSSNYLLFDLGDVTVTNKFEQVGSCVVVVCIFLILLCCCWW